MRIWVDMQLRPRVIIGHWGSRIMVDITQCWRREAARFKNVDELKKLMDDNIARSPVFYKERMRLLDEFFAEHHSPVDIVLVLYGALSDAHHLAYHLEDNNLLFYRPKASHRRFVEAALFEGEVHPERTLLIFDQDMVTGDAMNETADFFTGTGYNRSRMFGYLDEGCKWRKYNTPELMHIDDFLKR